MSTPGIVDAERLDYALRRRTPSNGAATWAAHAAINALAYACCQHMQGVKRRDAERALAEEANSALQALAWPGKDLWRVHTSDIEVRRWREGEELPALSTRGSFASRGRTLAQLLMQRVVHIKPLEELNDPAQRPVTEEADRWE